MTGDQGPAAVDGKRGSAPTATAPASRATTSFLAWDFTVASRSARPSACCTCATTRSRTRRHGPRRPEAGGRLTASRSRTKPTPADPDHRAESTAPSRSRATCRPPAARRAGFNRRRRPDRAKRQRPAARFTLHHPARRAAPATGPRRALRPRPARQPRRGRPGSSRRWRTSTTSSSARPTGAACRRSDAGETPRSPTRSRTSSNVPVLADRLQQGMLNFLFLGRAMVHAAGFAQRTRRSSRPARSPLDRAAVLRRQQPGRHHGRRARPRSRPDFDRAVLGVAGHELLDAAARARVDFDAVPRAARRRRTRTRSTRS